jgi:hypothetical protein
MVLSVAGIVAAGASAGFGARPKAANAKKVLVELYTSQGCDSCPSAADLVGRLASLGYGRDRIVPLAFHVDYFNEPWKDPYSDPAYSQREMAYNGALNRKDLYFTPMMMIDGRYPMLGSDQPKVKAALDRALKERPGVTLGIDLAARADDLRLKTLNVTLAGPSAEAADRDLLVGVALFEDPVTTAVLAGENAGKTLVEHDAVRKFVYQKVQLSRSRPSELTFPLELPVDADPMRCGVAAFVQDWTKGTVHQADAVPWTVRPSTRTGARPSPAAKRGRRVSVPGPSPTPDVPSPG